MERISASTRFIFFSLNLLLISWAHNWVYYNECRQLEIIDGRKRNSTKGKKFKLLTQSSDSDDGDDDWTKDANRKQTPNGCTELGQGSLNWLDT